MQMSLIDEAASWHTPALEREFVQASGRRVMEESHGNGWGDRYALSTGSTRLKRLFALEAANFEIMKNECASAPGPPPCTFRLYHYPLIELSTPYYYTLRCAVFLFELTIFSNFQLFTGKKPFFFFTFRCVDVCCWL